MTTNSIDALKQVFGARFHKCALQVNPPSYSSNFRGQTSTGSAEDFAEAMLDRAVDLGIEVLAITDHSNVSSIPTFQAAAANRGLHIFPGFELTSSEGIHVLCLYDPHTDVRQLERYLGNFGVEDPEPSSQVLEKPFKEVLQLNREQGGIAIAAHVTESKGLLTVLQGQSRCAAWRDENLLAVQIPGEVAGLAPNYRTIVENRNPEYSRTQALALINAKDIVTPDQLEHRSATSWIKMDEVGIEGLRQAFLDPESRIRLNTESNEFEPDEHVEFVSIGWEGGFFDQLTVSLNPNLNVVIGGRGTGKSTIVESIRAAIGLAPLGEDARKTHEGIVRHVLRSGTKISLRVRIRNPGLKDYAIERTIPNPPIVRGPDGSVLHSAPLDILPEIEVYGQHEIFELANDADKRIRLLDRFVSIDDTFFRRKESLKVDLAKNREALRDTQLEIVHAKEKLAFLPRLQETLQQFQDAGIEDRLREKSLLVREESILDSIPDRLSPFNEFVDRLRRELPLDMVFLSARALEGLPGKRTLEQLNPILRELEKEAERLVEELDFALKRAERRIDELRNTWKTGKDEIQKSYETILRELQKSSIDGAEFINLRRRIEDLRPLSERLESIRLLQSELESQRHSLLAEWEDIKATEFRAFATAATALNEELRGQVEVALTSAGNREPLFKLLRDEIGGRISETIEIFRTAPEISLTELVATCRSGGEALCEKYDIPATQAERIAAAEPESFMRIEELELEPSTTIRLNTASSDESPVWQQLEDLSTGQKSTAVLLLLLHDSHAPLVIDQPEDDLDNRFVTQSVVPRMRREKQRRQLLFTTHNANIPVLGDAELIVGLSSVAPGINKARIADGHSGSIDSKKVRELVEEILEGGRDAFEIRRRKYGF